jgi:hypothetical protein
MATRTLGTVANNSLTAIKFGMDVTDADFATIINGIKDDAVNGNPIFPGAFSRNGQLFVPNRGWLKVLPGDYVGIETATGWPILLSAACINAGGTKWAHS